ncbi:hypothetical protein [Amycolatopsis sp. NPDC052450]|uniref:hypothetical protein n=1 Tax=Amycolatopsis sp. NPDC052450 TaxID=3363937 RepID=UPI0037CAB60E
MTDNEMGDFAPGEVAAAVRSREALRPPGRVGVLTDRLLTAAGTRQLREVLPAVNADWGGVWVCGSDADRKIATYREDGFDDLILVSDSEHYRREFATAREPFKLPDTLGASLNSVVQDQLDRGASVATTPSRYVRVGDKPALLALVRGAAELDRDDTVLVVAVALAWLKPAFVDQFIEILKLANMPIALMFGGQYDPLNKFKAAVENLRRVEREVPHVMRGHTDLSAIDGLCHGAFAGSIGLTSSRRHLIPPDEVAQTSGPPGKQPPSVLIPELLSFMQTPNLAKKFANRPGPSCFCAVCKGRRLVRLIDAEIDKVEAQSHNVAVWGGLMNVLLAEVPARDARALAWKTACQAAVDHHAVFNRQVDNDRAFTAPEGLRRWAALPA